MRFFKFLLSGGANTLVTYALYLWLLNYFPYQVCFSIAFFSGIIVAYFLSRYIVFQKSAGRLGPLWVFFIYFFQYALGIFLVTLWVKQFSAPPFLAPLFSTVISLPITYGLSRLVFRSQSETSSLTESKQ